jgi:AraC family transcriptional regulator of adaptative response / DNA-3-methyladenine glycosylase II
MHGDDTLWRAMTSRDRRFEGVFVVGVRTTGIYCRPGCPARMPKRANVTFFGCAAAAEQAGFRACMRCRPDRAPGAPTPFGTPATVTRALRLIAEGGLDREPLEEFAERLGVGGRHLRRLFDEHVGASPAAVAQTHRAHFARQLVESTDMPMTHVALAAGFASVRRFNGAVRTTFGLSPTELRRRAGAAPVGDARGGVVALRLPMRPPFEWDALLAFLAARAIPGVEHVQCGGPAGGAYARTLGPHTTLAVRRGGERHLGLEVRAGAARAVDLFGVVARVRRLFDLDCDPVAIAGHLQRDPVLGASVRRRPGLRVPGAWDALEIAVRAVLGQQVTVAGATTLAGRLVERFGQRVASDDPRLGRLFPDAPALAEADLGAVGLPRARAETIRALARLAVSEPEALDDPTRLLAVRGVGPWTAAYVAMRAGRDPDALPAGDLGLRRTLGGASAREVERRAGAWRPWRAYAVMHLWCGEEKEKR